MTNRWVWAVVVAAGLGLAACGDDDDDGGAGAPGPSACTPPATATVFFHEDVHNGILTSRCTPCHADAQTTLPKYASADRNTSYAAVLDAVNVTSAAQSLLIRKGDGQVTHGGGDVLEPAHVTSITQWIRECARNNSRLDPTTVPTT